MQYNPILTTAQFNGNLTVKCRHKLITDAQGKVLGTMSNKHILDLNGQEVANFDRVVKSTDAFGDKKKSRIYKSATGEFSLRGAVLFDGDAPIGKVRVRERRASRILVLILSTLMLFASLGVVLMIDLPFADVPQIEVEDKGGTWQAQGTIAVLDDSVSPGSEGEYTFVLSNPHNVAMSYEFFIKEYFNDQEVNNFPMQFRLRMNNVLIKTDEWLSSEQLGYSNMIIEAESTQRFTLEWRWAFESGNDEIDTHFGESSGSYKLTFEMIAQESEG